VTPGPDLWTALGCIAFLLAAWFRYEHGRDPDLPVANWKFLYAACLPVLAFTVTAYVMEGLVTRA